MVSYWSGSSDHLGDLCNSTSDCYRDQILCTCCVVLLCKDVMTDVFCIYREEVKQPQIGHCLLLFSHAGYQDYLYTFLGHTIDKTNSNALPNFAWSQEHHSYSQHKALFFGQLQALPWLYMLINQNTAHLTAVVQIQMMLMHLHGQHR